MSQTGDSDRVKEIQYNTGEGGAFETKYAYTYTAAGQLYSVTDYVSEETHLFTYDTQGKKIRSYLVDNTTNEVAYRDIVLYDAQERVSQFTQLFAFANAGVETVTSNYTYNTDGEMDHYTQTSTDLAVETNYYYDDLGRATRRKIAFSSGGIGRHAQINYYTFATSNGNTSSQVSSVLTEVFYGTDTSTSDGALTSTTYNLTYDANGNITKIANALGVAQYQYAYDSMGQLTREDNRPLGKTFVYEYDNAGNITKKIEYTYTEGSLAGATPASTTNYTYGNASWGDQLTSVGGATLTYDAIGNLVGIGSATLTWQGRELQSYGNIATYTYNVDGIRTSKTVNGVKHTYVLYGSQILSETWGDNVLLYIYDELNTPVGLKYRNSTYTEGVYDCFFFEKNFLGDIVAIYDENGVKLGTYNYDAWGDFTVIATNATAGSLAYNILYNYNPFRYRGYYYDVETGLYYLQSRYYNAEWGRFISGDTYVSTGQGILGYNMYAYCGNNPVARVDSEGDFPVLLAIAITFLVATTVVGGYAGATAEEPLIEKSVGPDTPLPVPKKEDKKNPALPYDTAPKLKQPTEEDFAKMLEKERKKVEDKGLTVGDRISNTIIGMGAGLFVGGTIVATAGIIAMPAVGVTAATMTGTAAGSVFAIGALGTVLGVCFMGPSAGNLEAIELPGIS